MGKKKNKINKISEEQYLQYIAGLKDDAALFTPSGEILMPDRFKEGENKEEKSE